jgi:hypothetical protein
MRGIIIKTTKEVRSDGVHGRRIREIISLKRDQLPTLYLEQDKHCFMDYCGKLIATLPIYKIIFEKEKFYSEKKFRKNIEFIYQCGDKLKEVKDFLKEKRKQWHGRETFVI